MPGTYYALAVFENLSSVSLSEKWGWYLHSSYVTDPRPQHCSLPLFQVTCVVHNFQSRPPSGRRLSPWEDLGQAPTVDSPLEKLSVAQVRGAGGCSRLERVVGGGGQGGRKEVRQEVGVSEPWGSGGITHLCGHRSWGDSPKE